MTNGAGAAHRYKPKLVTTLKEGYGRDALQRGLP
jgi:hypothetical protein